MLTEPCPPATVPERVERCAAIVLGAGVTGLVSASVLLRQGVGRVCVIDAYPRIGGNHLDVAKGPFTFDVGSFIFQDDSPLLNHFPSLLERYVPISPSWGRLNPQGMVTAYPISVRDDVLAAGPLGMARIALSVVRARLGGRGGSSARDFARYWIGDHLLRRSGLEAYMRRFYGIPPEQIDIRLAEKRMLWISEHASLRNQIRRLLRPAAPGPANRQMARPREGFAALYEPLRAELEARGATFRLGTAPDRLVREDGVFRLVVGGETIVADRVISTVPLPVAARLCGLGDDTGLEAIHLISLFFSFAGDRGFSPSILYNFSPEGAWKRLTVYSDFYGPAEGRAYFAVEVIGGQVGDSAAAAEADFRDHVRRNGLFRGDLRLEGHYSLDHAYPIYSGNAGERAAAIVAALKALGVESFGRQGGFDYQPTARVSTHVAEAALAQKTPLAPAP
jgi:hypothetical protein